MRITKALTGLKLARSNSEAYRLVKQGAVRAGGCTPGCDFINTGVCHCGGWRRITDPKDEVRSGEVVKIGKGAWRLLSPMDDQGSMYARGIGRVPEMEDDPEDPTLPVPSSPDPADPHSVTRVSEVIVAGSGVDGDAQFPTLSQLADGFAEIECSMARVAEFCIHPQDIPAFIELTASDLPSELKDKLVSQGIFGYLWGATGHTDPHLPHHHVQLLADFKEEMTDETPLDGVERSGR